MSKLVQRIRSSRDGFTMGELLISILIMGMVSALMATGISVSAHQYKESMLGSESHSLCSTLTVAVTDALASADDFKGASATTEDGVEHYTYSSFWASDGYQQGIVALDSSGAELGSGKSGYLALKTTDGKLAKLLGASSYTWGMKARAQLDWNNAGSTRYSASKPVCDVTLIITDSEDEEVARTTFTVVPSNS